MGPNLVVGRHKACTEGVEGMRMEPAPRMGMESEEAAVPRSPSPLAAPLPPFPAPGTRASGTFIHRSGFHSSFGFLRPILSRPNLPEATVTASQCFSRRSDCLQNRMEKSQADLIESSSETVKI